MLLRMRGTSRVAFRCMGKRDVVLVEKTRGKREASIKILAKLRYRVVFESERKKLLK